MELINPGDGLHKAYGAVWKTRNGTTALTTVSVQGTFYLQNVPTTALDPSSTSHFTSTNIGDLVYAGPTKYFRQHIRHAPSSGFVSVHFSPAINTVQQSAKVQRGTLQAYETGQTSDFIIQLSDGDSVRHMIANESSVSNITTNSFFMELREI